MFIALSGYPEPFGCSQKKDGTNFAIPSKHAKEVSLCLFQGPEKALIEEIQITAKTGDVWHILIQNPPEGLFYLFKIDGKELLDPYAREVNTTHHWKEEGPYRPMGAVLSDAPFDWEGDVFPLHRTEDLILYEMHTRGFTQHPSSHVSHPGTFLGIVEKIPYLLELGINAIELLPIFEFDEKEYTKINPKTQTTLCNYWGYSTVNFFSPMQRYATTSKSGMAIQEFKTMVKALHKNGIEVILDVVYNHTAEGNGKGPTLSFKGIDLDVYYILDPKGNFLNFSGCGNTFNCNHPIVRALIIDSLRYWATEMHVDGFRFDLATILARGTKGELLPSSPILEAISEDPILSKKKLIAEPWDAGGGYQVGTFFPQSNRWSEWNGKYRDVVRRFIKGTEKKGPFVTKICGSQDLYHAFSPCRSINFLISHDGFTLADLVSYNEKHNLENGEENRDGTNDNESWNCGVEGPTTSKKILSLRERQMRNYQLALMVSRGTPMLHMGDEYGHTKLGNNNAWCQDNELNWFLWNRLEENKGFFRYYQKLIAFRKTHHLLRENRFFAPKDIDWHGKKLLHPCWDKEDNLVVFTIKDYEKGNDLFIAFNASLDAVTIEFPHQTETQKWRWVVNTASPSPYDFREGETATFITAPNYKMLPYSALVLEKVNN